MAILRWGGNHINYNINGRNVWLVERPSKFGWSYLFPSLDLTPCKREKDDTDTRLAMLKLFDAGVKKVYVFGGLGGKYLDHSIANIQLIHEFTGKGMKAFLISESEYLYVLKAGERVTYPSDSKGIISLFSLSEETTLSIRDLYYEYEGKIDNKRAFTVSNEFHQKGGTIEVFEGAALIVRPVLFSEDHFNISMYFPSTDSNFTPYQ